MTITQMKYFSSIIKNKSISMAAKENYVSITSISKLIHDLESNYEIKLFIKKRNSYILTEYGEQINEKVKKILLSYEELEQTFEEIKKKKKIIIVGIAYYLDFHIFHSFLYFLIKNKPDIEFKILYMRSDEVRTKIEKNEIDIGFYLNVEGSNCYTEIFDYIILRKDKLYYTVAKSHFLSNDKTIIKEKIKGLDTALLERQSGTMNYFKENFINVGLELNFFYYPAKSHIINELLSGSKGSLDSKGFLYPDNRLIHLEIEPNLFMQIKLGFNQNNLKILKIVSFINENFNEIFNEEMKK